MSESQFQSAAHPRPLFLLMRVNMLQMWRRLKSVREQSRLLTGVIVLFMTGYLGLSFWLFYKGLMFVGAFPGLGIVLTERLLYLLFAFLFVLLLLSNLVISYTNFFRNREATYLLSLPVPTETIFRWKFFESVMLASWAFLFLIAPLLVAFGLTRDAHWHFYVVTVLLVGMFIILPGVFGSWLAITLARHVDRKLFQMAALLVLLVLIVGAAFLWKTQPAPEDLLEMRVIPVLDQLLVKTRFAQFPFLPSYWLSSSVLNWTEGVISVACFFVLVLLSHVVFFGFLAFTRLGRLFYDASSTVQSRASVWGQWEWFRARRKKKSGFDYAEGPAEKIMNRITWLDADVKALLVKDIRMFWRDTAQWGQSVMLFGLLAVYIINLRHFTHQMSNPFWVHLVAYLNLGACSLNLATLTTRFVYPQFSLEGRRLWVVGMAPMGLERVVRAKYWLATSFSLVVTLSLIVLSCYLLEMPWGRIAYFMAIVTIMTVTLNGLAAGLGVLYPNFKEGNPSKIVSGFGGTFCLVLSFLYILGSVLLLAIGSGGMRPQAGTPRSAFLCILGFSALSMLLGWLPLRVGFRQLKKFEF